VKMIEFRLACNQADEGAVVEIFGLTYLSSCLLRVLAKDEFHQLLGLFSNLVM
jgi:hypothetical protein